MEKLVLENIAGVEIWPILSMIIFITMFLLVIVWVIRLDKREVQHMSRLPLEPDNSPKNGDINHG